MRLLVRPYTVALPVCVPECVILTRLIMGGGVRVTEVVTGVDRLTIHLQMYADILRVDITAYPILMVVCLSVWVDVSIVFFGVIVCVFQ